MFTSLHQPSLRILVVDDLPDNLFLLQVILESAGFTVETADSGQAALKQIARSQPNLVLLDLMMPDISGYQVTQRMQQDSRLAEIPVLLITAYREALNSEDADCKISGVIHKPIDVDELLLRVRSLLQVS